MPLFELAGHTPAPPPAFEVPQGPGTLPRPAYLVWRAVQAAGELALKCADVCRGRACCLTQVMALEHGLDAPSTEKALKKAVGAGWVGEVGGGRSSPAPAMDGRRRGAQAVTQDTRRFVSLVA